MAVVVAAEVYRLVQTGNYGGVTLVQNVFHFGREQPGGSPSTLVNDWHANIVTQLMPYFHPIYEATEVRAQRIAPDESDISRISGVTKGGNFNFNALPAVAAGIVTWRTQLAGRSRRGRTYWAGLPYDTGNISDGSAWKSDGIVRLENIANLIRNRYTLGGNPGAFYLGVWSPTLGGKLPPRDPAKGLTMVVGFTAQEYICSMGSRRLGHGL